MGLRLTPPSFYNENTTPPDARNSSARASGSNSGNPTAVTETRHQSTRTFTLYSYLNTAYPVHVSARRRINIKESPQQPH
jgi:hypothetical protein